MVGVKAGILTVSDRCSHGEAQDTSGPNLKQLVCKAARLGVCDDEIVTTCVPDNMAEIQRVLLKWSDELHLALVLTTGGTGFSPSDVTPEATQPLLDKTAPGITVAMISQSLAVTPMAMLSRPACGIRKTTLIINLPGSKKASEECFQFILPALPHALDLLSQSPRAAATHREMAPTVAPVVSGGDGHLHVCPHGHVKAAPVGKRTRADFELVTDRPRHSPYPMLPVDKAMEIIFTNTPTALHENIVNVEDALGYIIAEDVYAQQPLPPFPASVKDGYAVIAADGPGDRDVLSPIAAGVTPTVTVMPGTVCRITTGAPVPPGADAVVQVEDTELLEKTTDGREEKTVKIMTSAKPGQDIRPIGFDIPKGEQVLSSGERLGPSELGLLAAVGVTQVKIYEGPKVGVLSTGNEVVSSGEPLGPGQIHDSNRTTLMAAVREEGFVPLDLGVAQDSRDSLKMLLTKGLNEADVVVTSGGVSMGEKDLLKPVLEEEFGATIHFGRVFMKPGKPTTFATVNMRGTTKLVFALPGNPVSCNVTFYLFALPALRKIAGWKKCGLTTLCTKLSSPVKLDPRPEYHRASLRWTDSDHLPNAVSTGSQCSSRLLSMKTANALLVLPPRSEDTTMLEAGTIITAMLIGHGF